VLNVRPCDEIIKHPKNFIPDTIIKTIYMGHLESDGMGEYNIYTDGSKTSDGVAFAMFGRQHTELNITGSSRIHD